MSLGGAGAAKLALGASETIKLSIVDGQATLGTDFTLSVEGSSKLSATIFEQGSDYVVVKMTALESNVNLTGLGFKVTIHALTDSLVESIESVKIELKDPSYGGIRLDKDDIGYNLVDAPTERPTEHSTDAPTERPTEHSTDAPTERPTEHSTDAPTERPAEHSTDAPTERPTEHSTDAPTERPAEHSTDAPTERPTEHSTDAPTERPAEHSTDAPTERPTEHSTDAPTERPAEHSTDAPTEHPTDAPSDHNNNGWGNGDQDAPGNSLHNNNAENAQDLQGKRGYSNDMIGGNKDDHLTGESNSDHLQGGAGNDVLTGGLGADTFRWELADLGTAGKAAHDVITDFAVGDKLNIGDILTDKSNHSISAEIDGKDTHIHILDKNGKEVQEITLQGYHDSDGVSRLMESLKSSGEGTA